MASLLAVNKPFLYVLWYSKLVVTQKFKKIENVLSMSGALHIHRTVLQSICMYIIAYGILEYLFHNNICTHNKLQVSVMMCCSLCLLEHHDKSCP